jgi:hypothetical protein
MTVLMDSCVHIGEGPRHIQEKLEILRYEIICGVWQKKHTHLLEKENLNLGYRLVVHEKP